MTLLPEGSCVPSNALRLPLKTLNNFGTRVLVFHFTLGPENCMASFIVLRHCDTMSFSYLLLFNSPENLARQ